MKALHDLIERLEKATGPDHELNCDIAEVIGRTSPASRDNYVLNPTGSTDAALTLLPKWASYELTRSAAGEPTFTRCRIWDWRRGPLMSDPTNEWKSEGNRPLPINISIAALKAIAATTPRLIPDTISGKNVNRADETR